MDVPSFSYEHGDEVFWFDPDDGKCSGNGHFVCYLNDEVALIEKDEVEIEVFVCEITYNERGFSRTVGLCNDQQMPDNICGQ
jgi:hypothetical protein